MNQVAGATALNEGAKVIVLVSATLDADAKLSDSTAIRATPTRTHLPSHNPNNISDEQTIPR